MAGGALSPGPGISCYKHGTNVAADPFTLAYTGVNGGLVIVSADQAFTVLKMNRTTVIMLNMLKWLC